MSHHQNASQNQYLMTANKTSRNVQKFKYLGITLQIKITFIKKFKTEDQIWGMLASHLCLSLPIVSSLFRLSD